MSMEPEMQRFRLPHDLQVLSDEVPDCEFLGSSVRIPRDAAPNIQNLIAMAKSALASKPKRKMHPPLGDTEVQAILAKIKRRKPQQNATLNQVDQQQNCHPLVAGTILPHATPTRKFVDFMPILNVGLSTMMEVDADAAPTHWEDTQEDAKPNKRAKLLAGG